VPSVSYETLYNIFTLTADFNGPVLKIPNYVRKYSDTSANE